MYMQKLKLEITIYVLIAFSCLFMRDTVKDSIYLYIYISPHSPFPPFYELIKTLFTCILALLRIYKNRSTNERYKCRAFKLLLFLYRIRILYGTSKWSCRPHNACTRFLWMKRSTDPITWVRDGWLTQKRVCDLCNEMVVSTQQRMYAIFYVKNKKKSCWSNVHKFTGLFHVDPITHVRKKLSCQSNAHKFTGLCHVDLKRMYATYRIKRSINHITHVCKLHTMIANGWSTPALYSINLSVIRRKISIETNYSLDLKASTQRVGG